VGADGVRPIIATDPGKHAEYFCGAVGGLGDICIGRSAITNRIERESYGLSECLNLRWFWSTQFTMAGFVRFAFD